MMLFFQLGTDIYEPSNSLLVNRDIFIKHVVMESSSSSAASKVSVRGRKVYLLVNMISNSLYASVACSCINPFHFIMELFWLLPFPLKCFSNITQDIYGYFRFQLFHVLHRKVSFKQASNCLSKSLHCTTVSRNFLVPNLSGCCWVVLVGFSHQSQWVVHTSLLYGKFLVLALQFLTCHY